MKLLITIPALNEENSIEGIICRSLAARANIISSSPVTDVEIVGVSDGSTDRTAELASKYQGRIKLIIFEQNRGYGAAIQEAWRQSDAALLGFLDADGTCDPNFFARLCSTIIEEDADVTIGSRLSKASKMPLIRRIGNIFFALMLSAFSSNRVRDVASGMRVLRRTCLQKLLPLPDGLHFTPAMSARAVLSGGVKLVEIDMPYREREGQSKLRMVEDGLRFLKVILQATLLYRPSRPLALLGTVSFAVAVGLMTLPIHHYLRNRSVAEWMIYRFVVSHLAGTSAFLFLCATYLTRKMVRITLSDRLLNKQKEGLVANFFLVPFFGLPPCSPCSLEEF